ncbi:MAG: hypothetical protein RL272_216 [Candidatus Parcubacteria bacterium]|jgi:histidine decarboxylase
MPTPYDNPYMSPFDGYCQGARDPNRYVVAFNVAAAKTKRRFTHDASDGLDRINAFDRAEIAAMNMGQINMIEVSSFCGREGYVWGRDIAAPASLRQKRLFDLPQWDGTNVPVFDGAPLIAAARTLFGTVESRRFPIAPGSHCPTAHKSVIMNGPVTLFSACGIGIRDPKGDGATILMEDGGTLPPPLAARPEYARASVLRSVAESVLAVAENQGIACAEVFVAYACVTAGEGEVGCALSMVPYFSLARRALPGGNIESLKTIGLEAWASSLGS